MSVWRNMNMSVYLWLVGWVGWLWLVLFVCLFVCGNVIKVIILLDSDERLSVKVRDESKWLPPWRGSSPPAYPQPEQHQRHHLSSTCLSVKSLATKNYHPASLSAARTKDCGLRTADCKLRAAHSDDLPASVCYPWVCCQKIIMPINFTHAGLVCPFISVYISVCVCVLVVNYTTKNYVWLLPAPNGRACLPSPTLARSLTRLRLISPHSFGSNLSCHAVIMTNKKEEERKK